MKLEHALAGNLPGIKKNLMLSVYKRERRGAAEDIPRDEMDSNYSRLGRRVSSNARSE